MHDKRKRRRQTVNHLNRILGQLSVLKEYIETDQPCRQVAQLTASITASFDSLKTRTLSGYIQNELLTKPLSKKQQLELKQILKLYRK